MRGPLPQEEFDHIFSRVPRLTVELVIASDDRGVLLAMRDFGQLLRSDPSFGHSPSLPPAPQQAAADPYVPPATDLASDVITTGATRKDD